MKPIKNEFKTVFKNNSVVHLVPSAPPWETHPVHAHVVTPQPFDATDESVVGGSLTDQSEASVSLILLNEYRGLHRINDVGSMVQTFVGGL